MLPDDEKESMLAVNRQDYAMLLDLKVCLSHFLTRFAYRVSSISEADPAIFGKIEISREQCRKKVSAFRNFFFMFYSMSCLTAMHNTHF